MDPIALPYVFIKAGPYGVDRMPRSALIRFLYSQPEPLHQITCLRRCGVGTVSTLQVHAVNNKIKCILFCCNNFIFAQPKASTSICFMGARPSGDLGTRDTEQQFQSSLWFVRLNLLTVPYPVAFSTHDPVLQAILGQPADCLLSFTTKSNQVICVTRITSVPFSWRSG